MDMDWKRVVFTDSKYWYYQYSDSARNKKTWAKASETPKIQVGKQKSAVHAYAGISYHGQTNLLFVSGTTGYTYESEGRKLKGVGAKEYSELLCSKLLPSICRLYGDQKGNMIFQQDGAPAHTSKSAQKVLKDMQISVLEWPPNSPDLSPIENAWAIVS